jgi:hypothetical protein
MKPLFLVFSIAICVFFSFRDKTEVTYQWIRINQLGYTPAGVKVAVWCSKQSTGITFFELIDSVTGKAVLKQLAGKNYGTYGPFTQTYRLNFSTYKKSGTYYLRAGKAISPTLE